MDPLLPPTVLQRLHSEVVDPTSVAGGLVGPVGYELRHISGLTAGAAHPIAAGGISFSGPNGEPGFRLDADADGTIMVTPLSLPLRLDDQSIDGPRQVGDSILDVGFAGFRVGSRRSMPHRTPGTPADPGRTVVRRPPSSTSISIPATGIEDRELVRLVQLEHQSVLRRARAMWPDPEEAMYHIFERGSRLWSEPIDDPAFGLIAVALGSLPWLPELSHSIELGSNTFSTLKGLQVLPSVPIVADLNLGPLGLVGPRDMSLAVARHIVLTRAVLSSPDDLAIGVAANAETIADWSWIESLPHLNRRAGARQPLRVRDDPTGPDGPADVIIASSVDQLPDNCAMSMIIGDNGTCTVIDADADAVTLAAMPLGLHPALAQTATDLLSELADAAPRSTPTRNNSHPVRSPIDVAPLAMGYESSFF